MPTRSHEGAEVAVAASMQGETPVRWKSPVAALRKPGAAEMLPKPEATATFSMSEHVAEHPVRSSPLSQMMQFTMLGEDTNAAPTPPPPGATFETMVSLTMRGEQLSQQIPPPTESARFPVMTSLTINGEQKPSQSMPPPRPAIVAEFPEIVQLAIVVEDDEQ